MNDNMSKPHSRRADVAFRIVFLILFLIVMPMLAGLAGGAIGLAVWPRATTESVVAALRDQGVFAREIAANPAAVVEALKRHEATAVAGQTAPAELVQEARDEATAWAFGAAEPRLVVVLFNDYNCPYCRRSSAELLEVAAKRPDLRFVIREFPIITRDSTAAAITALALRSQNLSFEFYRKAEAQSGPITQSRAVEIAREIGADMDRLKDEMVRPEAHEAVLAGLTVGARLGVSGTPTFLVGDEIVRGYTSAAELLQIIERVAGS